MKRMYITSLYRLKDIDVNAGGELGRIYILDWDTKEMLNNPRGLDPGYSLNSPTSSSHGARGVTVHEGALYVAGSGNKISKFDLDTYKLIDVLEFGALSGLHQIKSRAGILYAVSTGTDCFYKIQNDKIIEEVKLSELDYLFDRFLEGANKDWGKGKLHFNSINWDESGDMYHVYFTPGMVFNYSQKEVVLCDKELLQLPHDILFNKDEAIVNSSKCCSTVSINLSTKECRTIFEVGDKDRHLNVIEAVENCCGFTRMLCLNSGILFVGSIPGRIHTLKYELGSYTHMVDFDFTTIYYEAIYDMVLDPRDW